jgi:hypothetical protein
MQQFWNIHQNLTFWMASAFLAGESALGIPMVGIPHPVTSACRNAYADMKCPFFLWDSSKTFQYMHLHRQAYRLTDMVKLIGPFWQLLVVNMPKNERFHSYTQVLVITVPPLLVTVTGWYHTKRPMHCGHFLIYCVSPIWILILDSSIRALWKIPAETSSSEAGRNLARNAH